MPHPQHDAAPDRPGHHEHTGHGAHAHGHDDVEPEAQGADLLDLDGEVLRGYWDAALDQVAAVVTSTLARAAEPGGPAVPTLPARIVDLGAGTGTGALGLARRWPEAEVVAVDVSELALARIDAKAMAAGVGGRVRTVLADLDAGWPDLEPIDLTWASMSLHHLADPGRTLSDLRRITRDSGLVAVAEFDEPLRFLPDDLGIGRPGFESRALDVLTAVHAEELPTIGSSWAEVLGEAGWTVLGEHDLVIDQPSPNHPLAGRYARAWFERLSHGLVDRLDAEDLHTLGVLLDDDGPQALLRRDDLHLHGVRTVTVARR
jgi:SAM-dependent methyltransferase